MKLVPLQNSLLIFLNQIIKKILGEESKIFLLTVISQRDITISRHDISGHDISRCDALKGDTSRSNIN